MIDHLESLVLEFLDKTLYDASSEQRLESQDIKRAVKTALEALVLLLTIVSYY